MKNIFLDTNIIIDFLADRPPFTKYAVEIFKLAENKKVNLFTSSHSYATTHYLLKKYIGEKELRNILHTLLDYVSIIPVDLSIIKRSLLSAHPDLEDAIQMFAAAAVKNIDCIVTRNLKDFKNAGITVLSPDELIQEVKS